MGELGSGGWGNWGRGIGVRGVNWDQGSWGGGELG